MILQHNLPGIISGRNMKKNQKKLEKNLEKLSSGYRINRAGDDAAGLAISEGMRWQITGIDQAKRNIQDGIGLTQTADGAMQEINDMLIRSRQLSTQAANGTYNDAERLALQEEIDEIKAEISRITANTEFNHVPLFPATEVKESESFIESGVEIYPVTFLPDWVDGGKAMSDGAQTDVYETELSYEGYVKDASGNATIQKQTGTEKIKHAAAKLDFSKLNAGNKNDLIGTGFYCTCLTCNNHYSVKFTAGTETNYVQSGNHHVYEIGIDNVGTGQDLVNTVLNGLKSKNPSYSMDQGKIVYPLGHYTMWRADPNKTDTLIIYDDRSSDSPPSSVNNLTNITWTFETSLGKTENWQYPSFNTNVYSPYGRFGRGVAYEPGTWSPPPSPPPPVPNIYLQVGSSSEETMEIFLPKARVNQLGIENTSVKTLGEANDSIEIFNKAIDYLDQERGRMGTYQNRLEHTYQSQSISYENLTQAESRIRDTDIAEEITDYTKNNVILQASQSMLAHANMLPENIMKLLS